jgi:hypothetical protein
MPISRVDCSRSQRQGGSRPDRDDTAHKRRHHAAGEQCRYPRNGVLLASDVEKMDEMIRLNVGALARLTYAAAPGFVAPAMAPLSTWIRAWRFARNAQRGLRRHKSVRAGPQRLAQTRTRRQGRASFGSPAGSDGGGSIRSIPTRRNRWWRRSTLDNISFILTLVAFRRLISLCAKDLIAAASLVS